MKQWIAVATIVFALHPVVRAQLLWAEALPATDVSGNYATLHGRVGGDGGGACEYQFTYGVTGSPITRDTGWTGSVRTGDYFSETIGLLEPETEYSFRARVRLKNSIFQDWSEERTFTTGAGIASPRLLTLAPTDVTTTSATLRGRVTRDGGEACQYRFRYQAGTTGAEWTVWKGAVTTGQHFSETVTGLTPGRYYRVEANLRNSVFTVTYVGPAYFYTDAVMPDVVGMTQSAAEAALTAAGLRVGIARWGPSDEPRGTVIEQELAAGQTLPGDSAVDLTLSQGSGGGGGNGPGPGPTTANPVAHWKLDETEGPIAFDSAGEHDGIVYGDALWQPDGGMLAGAIQLDGIDDFVACRSVPVSGKGPRTIAGWARAATTPVAAWTNVFGFTGPGGNGSHFDIECVGQTGTTSLGYYGLYAFGWQQNLLPVDLDWHHFAATYDGTTASWYADGVLIGSEAVTLNTGDTIQIGKRANSSNCFGGLVDDVRLYDQALSEGQIQAVMAGEQTGVPSESRDIGTTGGSDFCEDGVYTIVANGSDIWAERDEFRYVYTTVTGDFEFSARVLSLENTDWWAKAGVMVRETLDPESRHAFMCVTPEQVEGRFAFQCRPVSPGPSSTFHSVQDQVSYPINTWVKIKRQGNTFTGLISQDGNAWVAFPGPYAPDPWATTANPVTIDMPQSVYVGLVVTSHSDGQLCTAEFDNVPFRCGSDAAPADLVAHWAFDETEGIVAHDSVGGVDGTLIRGPVWQPGGGKVGGALKFDGVNDSVLTEFVLSPADGPFSVFAWVKGGAPGEVIVSQDGSQGGADWLLADPSAGRVMTELGGSGGGRFAASLRSEMLVTDGNWHEVGLAWDGAKRTLYVNGVTVATDTQAELAGSTGGLNIGAGKDLDVGTYWTGLIDEVRLYDQAVAP